MASKNWAYAVDADYSMMRNAANDPTSSNPSYRGLANLTHGAGPQLSSLAYCTRDMSAQFMSVTYTWSCPPHGVATWYG